MLYINLQLVWSLFFQEFQVILFNYHRAIDHSLYFHPQTISLQQVVVLTVIQMLACNTKQLHKMLCELQWYFANTLNILQEKRSLLAGMHILKKKEEGKTISGNSSKTFKDSCTGKVYCTTSWIGDYFITLYLCRVPETSWKSGTSAEFHLGIWATVINICAEP